MYKMEPKVDEKNNQRLVQSRERPICARIVSSSVWYRDMFHR